MRRFRGFTTKRDECTVDVLMRSAETSAGRKTVRGFTLIELLVVIAIIGILSAVVLASLSSARVSANDAAVKTDLEAIISQAELYYGSNGNQYATGAINNSCTGGLFSDPTVAAAISGADKANGTGTLTCYASTNAYAVQAYRANTSNSTYWCVDSTAKKCGINSGISGTSCGTCATTD